MKVSVLGGEERPPLNFGEMISNLMLSRVHAKTEVSSLPHPTLGAVHREQSETAQSAADWPWGNYSVSS